MRRDIEFKSEGVTCRGWIYTPDKGKAPFPCVITGAGGGYVKEFAIMTQHAEEFARHGVASIVFDYRHYGASEGSPRQHIDPYEQIQDIRNAISLAETLPNVDPERLGFWGISIGGGYAFMVPALDSRVKCTVGVVPMVDGYAFQKQSRGDEGFDKVRELILEDRRKRFKDGTWGYLPCYVPSLERGKESSACATDNYEVFMEVAKTAPAWENRRTIASIENFMHINVEQYLPRLLSIPMLMIVIEGDTFCQWENAIKAYNKVPSPHKKLLLLPSEGGTVNHLTLYSKQADMEKVKEPAVKFLVEQLVEPFESKVR